MEKSKILNLMQFVVDQNKTVIFDSIKKSEAQLTEAQLRALLLAVEQTTKNSFFRLMDK